MKAIVLAYHNVGCAGIKALLKCGIDIITVFTHRDDPQENIWFESVSDLAASQNIPVYAPDDINHPIWVERIRDLNPDIIFSFYYRKLLGKAILDIPPKQCINLHGSLLPKYRGRCPVNWMLVNGEKEGGVTLHYMTQRPDDGDIIYQKKLDISDDDTAKTLYEKTVHATAVVLDEIIPKIKDGTINSYHQDDSKASYYGGRRPEDGAIDWAMDATTVRNLVRAVTYPYPGAFSYFGGKKYIFWKVEELSKVNEELAPGVVVSTEPLIIKCGEGALKIVSAQSEGGIGISGIQLANDYGLSTGMMFAGHAEVQSSIIKKKKVLILGANGFIGTHLSERLLESGKYEVYGMDLKSDYIQHLDDRKDFFFCEGDVSIHNEWIEYHIKKCDIVIPLVAIATPIEYIRNPLLVFELDFEENLRIVRYCVKYKKRIIFPSTSEVYGMSDDKEFDEESTSFVLGPIKKQRWIYSCLKQLLDRVIWAYGQKEGLDFTLFRPFNFIGPKLDRLTSARIGSSRVITQLILNLVEGTPIQLVDGGLQKRCFTDVKDGVECLYRIIENSNDVSSGRIFNIGNPNNELSIKELGEVLVERFQKHNLRDKFPSFSGFRVIESESYYGKGYQDVHYRRPSIGNAQRLLKWNPVVDIEQSVESTLDFFLREALTDCNV